jgi:hypothetical protein
VKRPVTRPFDTQTIFCLSRSLSQFLPKFNSQSLLSVLRSSIIIARLNHILKRIVVVVVIVVVVAVIVVVEAYRMSFHIKICVCDFSN